MLLLFSFLQFFRCCVSLTLFTLRGLAYTSMCHYRIHSFRFVPHMRSLCVPSTMKWCTDAFSKYFLIINKTKFYSWMLPTAAPAAVTLVDKICGYYSGLLVAVVILIKSLMKSANCQLEGHTIAVKNCNNFPKIWLISAKRETPKFNKKRSRRYICHTQCNGWHYL